MGLGAGSGPRRPAVVVAVAVALTLAACSSGHGSSGSSSTSTGASSAPHAPVVAAYARRGPYPTGVTRLALADGRAVVVWYPAVASAAAQPSETFDLASLLSPELQAKIPAGLRPQYEIATHPGAPPVTGRSFPVVLFSHGYAGFPEQSANLTTHLASWGFIVVAPDHVERSLDGLLGNAARGVKPLSDTQVLSSSLDLIANAQHLFRPPVPVPDLTRVAVIGHSSGALAAYQLAGVDHRIRAFVSYAVDLHDTAPGSPTSAAPPPPSVPGMVMTGTADGVIPAATSEAVYAGMRGPKHLVTIGRSGHLVFSDLCLIGAKDGGLAALARKVGINVPADLLKLADDGCGPRYLDPRLAFPLIDDLTVAFLRASFGIDHDAANLAPSVLAAFPAVTATITSAPG